MPETFRILAFGAHPDDIEYGCAGTLALLRQAGWSVGIATMTGGEGGSREHGPEETRRIRTAEAAAAAELLDAPYYSAGGMDMDVDFRHDLRARTVHVLRQFRPDVVVTVPPTDYHSDHEETSRLVRSACFFAPIPNYPEQELAPIDRVPYLYHTHEATDIHGRPTPIGFVVDISSVQELKERMVACHASQRDWLRAHHGTDDYILSMYERDAEAGRRAGIAAGEGFCQHLGRGYPHRNVIAEALGDAVRGNIIGP